MYVNFSLDSACFKQPIHNMHEICLPSVEFQMTPLHFYGAMSSICITQVH